VVVVVVVEAGNVTGGRVRGALVELGAELEEAGD
jgi:hypothetical protein